MNPRVTAGNTEEEEEMVNPRDIARNAEEEEKEEVPSVRSPAAVEVAQRDQGP